MADKPKRNWAAFLTGQSEPDNQPVGRATPIPPPSPDVAHQQRPVLRHVRPARPVSAPKPPQHVPPLHRPLSAPPPADGEPSPVVVDDGVVMVLEEDPYGDPMVDPRYDLEDRNWVRYRSSWGGFLRLVLFIILIVLTVLWVRSRIYSWVDNQIVPTSPQGQQLEFEILPGASVNDVAGSLDSTGVISNATVFRYWLRCEGELSITGFLGCDTETSFQAGEYLLYENMDFESAVAILREGPIPEVFFTITIPEGLRWSEMARHLANENPEFDRGDLEAAFVSSNTVSEYLPENAEFATMEGLLFPATYDISEDDLADEHSFLKRMSDEFDSRFTGLLDDPGIHPDLVELEIDLYDVIVIASLIEEEYLVPGDQAKIARVIYNRLAVGERLGIDASTCYAANKPCSELTTEDLESPSPWNTRAVPGIPPTPISAPSEGSMRAALQPAEGDWLFYVLTDEDGVIGAHHFSVTLAEHNEYVAVCRELGYC